MFEVRRDTSSPCSFATSVSQEAGPDIRPRSLPLGLTGAVVLLAASCVLCSCHVLEWGYFNVLFCVLGFGMGRGLVGGAVPRQAAPASAVVDCVRRLREKCDPGIKEGWEECIGAMSLQVFPSHRVKLLILMGRLILNISRLSVQVYAACSVVTFGYGSIVSMVESALFLEMVLNLGRSAAYGWWYKGVLAKYKLKQLIRKLAGFSALRFVATANISIFMKTIYTARRRIYRFSCLREDYALKYPTLVLLFLVHLAYLIVGFLALAIKASTLHLMVDSLWWYQVWSGRSWYQAFLLLAVVNQFASIVDIEDVEISRELTLLFASRGDGMTPDESKAAASFMELICHYVWYCSPASRISRFTLWLTLGPAEIHHVVKYDTSTVDNPRGRDSSPPVVLE